MEIEKRCVIKFFANERKSGVEIISCLRNYYAEDAVSRRQVCFWIDEVRRERTDPSMIATPGIEIDKRLPVVIAGKLDADSHLCARQMFFSQILG
jgi:hypothetical protein